MQFLLCVMGNGKHSGILLTKSQVGQLWNYGCWTTVELWIDSQEGKDIFLFYKMSALALGPIQPPFRFVLRALSLE
jgi:hypothetical protein